VHERDQLAEPGLAHRAAHAEFVGVQPLRVEVAVGGQHGDDGQAARTAARRAVVDVRRVLGAARRAHGAAGGAPHDPIAARIPREAQLGLHFEAREVVVLELDADVGAQALAQLPFVEQHRAEQAVRLRVVVGARDV